MNVSPITRTGVSVVLVAGTLALLAGELLHGFLPGSHQAWDVALMGATVVLAVFGFLALRRSRRLWDELERRTQALQMSEERHRLLLEQASDAIVVIGVPTGNIMEVNRSLCALLGRTEDELVGRLHTVLLTEAGRLVASGLLERLIREGGVVDGELVLRHKDGVEIPVHGRASLTEVGGQRLVQVIFHDMRQRIQIEDALRRSEARLREIFERVPVAIIEEDCRAVGDWLQRLRSAGVKDIAVYLKEHPETYVEGASRVKITGANPAALRSVGAPDMEAFERKLGSFFLPAHRERVVTGILEALWEGRSELVCEVPYRRADGSVGEGVLHWSVTKIDGCADLGRVVVVYTDLSALKAAEARLRDVEDRWELAVRAINVGIFEKNYVTGEVYVSERWKQMLGYAPDEQAAIGEEWQARIHPEDRARVIGAFQAHLHGENEYYRVEYRMLCKDGSYKWISSRGRAIFDAAGQPVRMIGAHTDISERKKAEAALRASETRHRELFGRIPVAVLEEDFSAVGNWLDLHGITTAHALDELVAREPDALVGAYGSIRLLAANRQASTYFALLQGAAPSDFRLRAAPLPSVLKAFREELLAIIAGRDEVNAEIEAIDAYGRRRHQAVRWAVARHEDGTLDLSRVLLVLVDITDIKNAEESVRRAEERWHLAVKGTQDGIWDYDFRDGSGFYSDRWKEMLGYGDGDVPANPDEWRDRVHPEDVERVMGLYEAHLRRETKYFNVEYKVRCGDGTYRWVLTRGQAIFDDTGRPLRMFGSQTDITERKLSETALRESESRFRLMFEMAPMALVEEDFSEVHRWMTGLRAAGVTDFEAYLGGHPEEKARALKLVRPVNCNDETLRIARASSKEELMANLGRLYVPSVLGARSDAYKELWEGRSHLEGELTMQMIDGTERRLFFRWWVPVLEGRLAYESALLAFLDLTDIRRTEAALAAERERLRVMLRAMAEGLLTTDTQGVVQFMNEAAERLTGWPAGTAVGRNVDEVCALRHEKTKGVIAVPIMASITEHRVVDFPLRTSLVHRQGTQCLIDGRCAPMHDLAGAPLGAVVVFRDVTERARLEAELLRSSKLESVGILAGGIAHDFNNILTVVMGNVTLAMTDNAVMEAAGRWLGEAERGVMRARDLTQQLLTFAKGGDPVRKTVKLPEVVREAAEFALHGSKVRLDLRLFQGLWPADVDKGQIGQVVQNLVINAVQAMPEGGEITISIDNEEITADSQRPLELGKYLRIVIADHGTGIRPEHLARIFDPYFTTKQSGSGLGLATVYSIIRRHQGHIDVESELGKGTSFFIWLPAATESEAGEAQEEVRMSGFGGRLLFMDDEETIRTLAGALLSRLGFEVVTVADGVAAVEGYAEARAGGRPFSLVIMDLTVPGGMGGREAMEHLLRIDPNVRAIVSSGYSSDPVLSNFRAHGFRGVVPKPYKLTDLARAVGAVMSEKY